MEVSSSSSRNTETDQWLNIFQMKQKLGLTHLENDDVLVVAELDRYEQRAHPSKTWAEMGMKEYKYVEHVGQKAEGYCHDHTMSKTMDASKAKPLPDNIPEDEIRVDWKKAIKSTCKSIKTQMDKAQKAMGGCKKVRSKIKQLEKLQDLGDKMLSGENGFNVMIDQWTDRLEGLENEAICEETHKSMKELMEEVKTTTVNFEQTVEAAAQAVVEAEKDKETKG